MAPRPSLRPAARLTAIAAAVTVIIALVAPAAWADDPTTTTSPTTTTNPATTAPATAPPTGAPTTTAAPPHPEAQALADLAEQVTKNQSLLVDLTAQVQESTQKLAALTAQIADTQQKLDAARAEITRLRTIMKARASYIYQHANAPQMAVVDIRHVEDISSGRKYAESAAHTDGAKVDDLTKASDELETRKEQLDAQQAAQQQEHDRLENARAALDALTTKQKKLLDEAGAIPVMGDAELTPEQVTAWFDARNAKYRLAGGMAIDDLVKIYFEEGAAEHVRPELAFAQSIIETGSFGNALDNNYSGIGACYSCQGEPGFPTPRDGVRGQIQLLRNYADPSSRASNLANPPSPTIWGHDPVQAAATFDVAFLKGKVPTWNQMGNGNWATDPGYALKVLTVYFQMLSFVAHHR
jgi:peptidoglycan hydrolase CwlO-like protein